MEENFKIKVLLEQIQKDRNVLNELCQYGEKAFFVAFEEQMYDLLPLLITPIEVETENGLEVKQCCEPFNKHSGYYSDWFNEYVIKSCETEIEVKQSAINEYERNKEIDFMLDNRTLKEIIADKKILPNKKHILYCAFNPNMELVMKMKIKNCLRKHNDEGEKVKSSIDVIRYAEYPNLYTCKKLFDKNILTTFSDFGGETARISIKYECLDDNNKKIANDLIEKRLVKLDLADGRYYYDRLVITVKCNENDTVKDVLERFDIITDKFVIQDMKYGFKTINEEIEYFDKTSYLRSEPEFQNGVDIESLKKYYSKVNDPKFIDEINGLIWDCEEYYYKHLDYLSSISEEKIMKI